MAKLRTDQVGRCGEYFVAAEIIRRGGYAVTFSGNMPDVDIYAAAVDHGNRITIQVKTKSAGTWQTSITKGHARSRPVADGRFWVFVDIGNGQPAYWIVPAQWIENNIARVHQRYVDVHGGHRAINPDAKHHAISKARIAKWKDRWDLLGILPDE